MVCSEFSVLLSVYGKEHAEWLRLALRSIWEDQIRKPKEIVLVKDGPLNDELEAVISDFAKVAPLKVVALDQNQGLGRALQAGLQQCSCELVARMDSDDLAKPERFERQIRFMEEHPDAAVAGSWIEEFIGSPENIVSERRLPTSPEELFQFGKKRNPMNHPTVMFRKTAVETAGGYEHFPLFEDYWLWCRMLQKGNHLYNIPEALLWFRTSPDVYKRRGGWRYAVTEIRFLYRVWHLGYISLPTFCINGATRFCIRIIPNGLRRKLYCKFARK